MIELCAIFHTLLADQDGLYDPTDYNDRLLLGLRGIMNEAELHILQGRMHQWWRKKFARGDVIIVRYADDFVIGFQHRHDAERFLKELRERLQKFGLALHPDKTRLIEFGRFADENPARPNVPGAARKAVPTGTDAPSGICRQSRARRAGLERRAEP